MLASRALVGRESELVRLDGELEAVRGGGFRCVAVEGDPGIGKSRLLDELASTAEERRCLVLRGAAGEFERDLPFGIFVDALEAHLALDSEWRRGWSPESLTELASVFPGLESLPRARGGALPDERYRAHRAIRALLGRLAARRPLVLALDDVHWADDASVEALAAILSRPPDARILLALALRPHGASERLRACLGAAGVAVLELPPLEDGDAERLLPDELDAAERAAVLREAEGNPLFLGALARAGARPAPEVPRSVSGLLLAELATLGPDERGLLDGAAVAGDPFEVGTAAAAGEVGDPLGALDGLLAAGLVLPTEVPRRFRFRHPLLRRAVYDAAGSGWRIGAHERVAAALAAAGAPAAQRAHHVEVAGRPGDDAAAALLLEAAEETVARTPATAAGWLAAALRLMRADDPRRADALLLLADALRSLGDCEPSREVLARELDELPDAATEVRLRLTGACAAAELMLGRHEQARERLERALGELGKRRSPAGASLLLDLAVSAFYARDFAAMVERATEALEIASEAGDDRLAMTAMARLANAAAHAGDVAEAERWIEAAAPLAAANPDLDALSALAWAELHAERFADARARFARCAELARAGGRGHLLPLVLQGQAHAALTLGEADEGAACLDQAEAAARVTGNDQVLCTVLVLASHAAGLRGERDEALRLAKEAGDLAIAFAGTLIAGGAGAAWAAALADSGEPAAAIEMLLEVSGGPELPGVPAAWRTLYLEILAEAELARGEVDAAESCADRAEALAATLGLPLARCRALRARARALAARGEHEEAADAASDAVAEAERVGARIDAARARVIAGESLASAGNREAAVATLRSAERELDACGAMRARAAARRALRELGARREVRGPAAGGDGLAALTKREREIALLVTDRRTNREIAEELFLSTKTVESHLRNVFAKLGVASRVEVARAMESDGQGSGPMSGSTQGT